MPRDLGGGSSPHHHCTVLWSHQHLLVMEELNKKNNSTNNRWGKAMYLAGKMLSYWILEVGLSIARDSCGISILLVYQTNAMPYPATHFFCFPSSMFRLVHYIWHMISSKIPDLRQVVWLSWHQLVKAGTMISPTPTHLPHHQWKHLIWGIGSKCSVQEVIQIINLYNCNSQAFRKDIKN